MREEKRLNNLKEARRLKALGRTRESSEKYRQAVKPTKDMPMNVAKAVKEKYGNSQKVKVVFAPYEADPQLVQLCADGLADSIVTEDSDVMLYCLSKQKAYPIIFKLNKDNGECDVISMDWLLNQCQDTTTLSSHESTLCRNSTSALAGYCRFLCMQERQNPGSGSRMFIQACILAGCDYSTSLPGVGLITAFKLIRDHSEVNPNVRLKYVVSTLKGKLLSSPSSSTTTNMENLRDFDFAEYAKSLERSEAAFYFQYVWCMSDNSVKHFVTPQVESTKTDIPNVDSLFGYDLSFLGSPTKKNHNNNSSTTSSKPPKGSILQFAKPTRKTKNTTPKKKSLLDKKTDTLVENKKQEKQQLQTSSDDIDNIMMNYTTNKSYSSLPSPKTLFPETTKTAAASPSKSFTSFSSINYDNNKRLSMESLAKKGRCRRTMENYFSSNNTNTTKTKSNPATTTKAYSTKGSCLSSFSQDDSVNSSSSSSIDEVLGYNPFSKFSHNNKDTPTSINCKLKDIPANKSNARTTTSINVEDSQLSSLSYPSSLENNHVKNPASSSTSVKQILDSTIQDFMDLDNNNERRNVAVNKQLPNTKSMKEPHPHQTTTSNTISKYFHSSNNKSSSSHDGTKRRKHNSSSPFPSPLKVPQDLNRVILDLSGDSSDSDCSNSIAEKEVGDPQQQQQENNIVNENSDDDDDSSCCIIEDPTTQKISTQQHDNNKYSPFLVTTSLKKSVASTAASAPPNKTPNRPPKFVSPFASSEQFRMQLSNGSGSAGGKKKKMNQMKSSSSGANNVMAGIWKQQQMKKMSSKKSSSIKKKKVVKKSNKSTTSYKRSNSTGTPYGNNTTLKSFFHSSTTPSRRRST